LIGETVTDAQLFSVTNEDRGEILPPIHTATLQMKLRTAAFAISIAVAAGAASPIRGWPRRAVTGSALAAASAWQIRSASAAAPPLAERVGEDGKLVLKDATAATIDVMVTPPKVTSRCYLDVAIDGSPAGRIAIDLYGEVAPRAAENFRALCTGEKGYGYQGSSFFKILSGLVMQAGEVPGHSSIYGDQPFAHDNYLIKHNVAGMVSMVNTGVGGNSGQSDTRFLIQLPDDAGFLDGRYEAFGRVSAGMNVVRMIEQVPVKTTRQVPVQKVSIEAAGELPVS
jgi:cyclophilin family peptidyl-prolyl cis-trans isomerase